MAAADDARRAGNPELLGEAALVMAGERGWSEAGAVDTELIALFEECLSGLPPGDSPLRARVVARLAGELYFLADESDRRHALTAEALELVDRLDDDDASVFVRSSALWGSWIPENADERRTQALEIVELSQRTGNRFHEFTGRMWLTICDAELGDGPGFRSHIDRCGAIASDLRQPEWSWITHVQRGALALMESRWDEAQVLVDNTLRIGSQLGSETVFQMYGVQVLALARARGDDAAVAALEPTLRSLVDQFPLIPSWKCGLAYLQRDLDRRDDARATFEALAVRDFADLPRDANWVVGIGLLAPVCQWLGDTRRAALLHDLLWPLRDRTVIAGLPADVYGSVHGPLMSLAATLGRWDDAEAHFVAAADANRRMGCRTFGLITELEWGRLLVDRGGADDLARARSVLSACQVACEEAGMTRTARLCAEGLVRAAAADG